MHDARRRDRGTRCDPRLPEGTRTLLVDGPHAERPRLEAFIRARYARAYEALVHHFLPTLLALEAPGGDLIGVLGAAEGRTTPVFYLERYLDGPAEDRLSARLGVRVPRACVAEVGNLSGVHAGAGTALVTAMAAYLDAVHCTWALFTATTAIRNGFAHLGAGLLDLGDADAARLDERDLAAWGTYYETAPRVVAAFLPEVLEAVRRRPALARRVLPLCAGARVAGAGRPALEACA